MIKKEDLLELYEGEENTLRSYVLEYLIDRFDDYDKIEDCINEILSYGCASGCVSSLIYYRDTLTFYERFSSEINTMVYELCRNCNTFVMHELFSRWDETDPLCLETNNRNLLAWFGFEETLYRVSLELEVLI